MSGPPSSSTAVLVHYSGWHLDGRLFDSSVERGEPACFLLGGVIRGWTFGVGGMKVGGRRKLLIPGALGYGARGNPQAGIAPDEMLVFDVELLAIDPYTAVRDPLPGPPVIGDATEMENGIKWYLTKEGEADGPVAAADSVVRAEFAVFLVDGKAISGSRGTPGDMPVDRLFPGLDQAIVGMHVGERRKFIVPYENAFGQAGNPPVVPPKATIIMDLAIEGIDVMSQVPTDLPGEPVIGEMQTTDSGLQYGVIAESQGEPPAETRDAGTWNATVHMTQWLVDGSVVRDTRETDTPLTFNLQNGEVEGVREGVRGMRVGEKRKLVIPHDLAYGPGGRGPVPLKATLIVDVELLSLEPLD